jgi:hypothetical protein
MRRRIVFAAALVQLGCCIMRAQWSVCACTGIMRAGLFFQLALYSTQLFVFAVMLAHLPAYATRVHLLCCAMIVCCCAMHPRIVII